MAVHVHSTPTPRVLSRRALAARATALAGAFASVGLTAGAATTMADVAHDPDAELIRLCADYQQASAIYRNASAQQAALTDHASTEWDRLDDKITAAALRMDDAEKVLRERAPTTLEGITAKASVAVLDFTYGRGDATPSDFGRSGSLAYSLARDLLVRVA